MDSRAKGRLALIIIAAIVAFAALIVKPIYACDSTTGCLNGVAANALPTYPEPATQTAAEPVKLKTFTRSHTRTARRLHSRKATLAQRARGSKLAKEAEQTAGQAKSTDKPMRKVAFTNANAELVGANADKPSASDRTSASDNVSARDKAYTSGQAPVAATEAQAAAAQTTKVELVAAEELNDIDRAAWDANQMPKLMQLTDSNSRAELRDDDSRWAQTSMIGKLFVAFGALLTIGSAIRMFMA